MSEIIIYLIFGSIVATVVNTELDTAFGKGREKLKWLVLGITVLTWPIHIMALLSGLLTVCILVPLHALMEAFLDD